MENNNGNNETNTETKYVFIEKEKNILGLIAIILAILGFIVPFLLGGFVLIFGAIVLGLFGLRNKAKGLAIGGIVLGILALLTSPSFWLLIASNNLNNSSIKENNKVIEESKDIKTNSSLIDNNSLIKNINEKKAPEYLIKKENGKLNIYTFRSLMFDGEKKEFAKKFGVNVSDINTPKLNSFEILKRVVMQDSDDKLKTQIEDFFNGLAENDKELNYNSNYVWVYKFKVKLDYLIKYKDVINKLYEYKGVLIELKENNGLELIKYEKVIGY